MPSKKPKLLTPSQMKCKKPRVVNYSGNQEKQQKARDIIVLYVECGLGYSPIRHILGLPNDKLVEDVIRQHMLGRNNVESRYLSEFQKSIIIQKSQRYLTEEDPYIVDMLADGKWSDDPICGPKICKVCGNKVEDGWAYCPFCSSKV